MLIEISGKILRERRKGVGLSQCTIAALIGSTQCIISEMERDHCRHELKVYLAYNRVLAEAEAEQEKTA